MLGYKMKKNSKPGLGSLMADSTTKDMHIYSIYTILTACLLYMYMAGEHQFELAVSVKSNREALKTIFLILQN